MIPSDRFSGERHDQYPDRTLGILEVQLLFPALTNEEKAILMMYAVANAEVKALLQQWHQLPPKETAKRLLIACRAKGAADAFFPDLMEAVKSVIRPFTMTPQLYQLLIKQFLSDIGTSTDEMRYLKHKQAKDEIHGNTREAIDSLDIPGLGHLPRNIDPIFIRKPGTQE